MKRGNPADPWASNAPSLARALVLLDRDLCDTPKPRGFDFSSCQLDMTRDTAREQSQQAMRMAEDCNLSNSSTI